MVTGGKSVVKRGSGGNNDVTGSEVVGNNNSDKSAKLGSGSAQSPIKAAVTQKAQRYVNKGSGIGINRSEIPKKRSPTGSSPKQEDSNASGELQLHWQYTSRSQMELALTPTVLSQHRHQQHEFALHRYQHQYQHHQQGVQLNQSMGQLSQHVFPAFHTPQRTAVLLPAMSVSRLGLGLPIVQGDYLGWETGIAGHASAQRHHRLASQDARQLVGPTVAQLGALSEGDKDIRSANCNRMDIDLHNAKHLRDEGLQIRDGNYHPNSNVLASKLTTTPATNSVTTSTTMPTTTVVSTTSIVSSVVQSQGIHSVVNTITTNTVVHNADPNSMSLNNTEGKRKQVEDKQNCGQSPKRINLGNSGCDDTNVLQRVLEELVNIKTMVGDTNKTVKSMQEENAQWKRCVTEIEPDVSDLKSSVEMAHQLIGDEAEKRKEDVNKINEALSDQKREITNSIAMSKKQADEIKKNKEGINATQITVNTLEGKNQGIETLVSEIRTKVEQELGEVTFPVESMVVTQSVWYKEQEDLEKVSSTIIHKALELPEVKIIRCEWKSRQETGSGLVKIQLADSSDVRKVLQKKKKLKES